MKNHYIKATLEMIQHGTEVEVVVEGLQKTMNDKGHIRLYASVLRGVLRVLETKTETETVVVVAKESDVEKNADRIKKSLAVIEAGEDFSAEIDETIIGGVIVKDKHTIIDHSYKTVLTNLYRSATK